MENSDNIQSSTTEPIVNSHSIPNPIDPTTLHDVPLSTDHLSSDKRTLPMKQPLRILPTKKSSHAKKELPNNGQILSLQRRIKKMTPMSTDNTNDDGRRPKSPTSPKPSMVTREKIPPLSPTVTLKGTTQKQDALTADESLKELGYPKWSKHPSKFSVCFNKVMAIDNINWDDKQKDHQLDDDTVGFMNLSSNGSYLPMGCMYFILSGVAILMPMTLGDLMSDDSDIFLTSIKKMIFYLAIVVFMRLSLLTFVTIVGKGCVSIFHCKKNQPTLFSSCWITVWLAMCFEILSAGTLLRMLMMAAKMKRLDSNLDNSLASNSAYLCCWVLFYCSARFNLVRLRCNINTGENVKVTLTDFDDIFSEDRDHEIKVIKRAAIAEAIIYCALPMLMVCYFVSILLGVLQLNSGISQFLVKLPLFGVMLFSVALSWGLYSRIYPSLAHLNVFFLLGLSVNTIGFSVLLDICDYSIMTIPPYIYCLLQLPMIITCLVSFIAIFGRKSCFRLFECIKKKFPTPQLLVFSPLKNDL